MRRTIAVVFAARLRTSLGKIGQMVDSIDALAPQFTHSQRDRAGA
ncbi:MAG: hypothetical protein AB7E81_16215 [Hyphomicrobiaceae bacterium]